MPNKFEAFFNPQGVVVLGASTHAEKLGYGVARNLVQSRYRGMIYFVNPKGGVLFGRRMFTRLEEVPDPVDLAVIVVPSRAAPDAIRACGKRGIQAAVLISSGFREVGPSGAALEAECVQAAREADLRLLGPNCIGLLDTHLPLDTTFLPPPMPRRGDVAFISHSGATCAAVVDWAREQGFGFSRLVSLGNQADINETDMLPVVADDPYTRVLTCYLEGISDGWRFVEVAAQVVRKKPVLALKVGRFASGQRAAASHTGALAGSDAAFDAAFEKTGVIRADTIEALFDWARALAWQPLPDGPRVAVLTNAGGPGVIAADALEMEGLQLAALAPQTEAALRDLLPPAASVHNPVDMLASATAAQYAEGLRLLLADENVDSVLIILPPPPMYPAEEAADALIEAAQDSRKPVVVALMGSTLIKKAAERFQAAMIPEYPFPERAAGALARLWERAQFLARPQFSAQEPDGIDRAAARRILSSAADGWLPPETALDLLQTYRIPVHPLKLAQTPDEAAALSETLGFPLAMKVASPDIPHKSDVGGVLLGLQSAEDVRSACARMLARVQRARPEARIEGVHLQRMVTGGQEVIVGALRDPQFGALVMFGSGGVDVEGLKDVAFALAPLSDDEAGRLADATWAGRKLYGYRSLPPADRAAVMDVLRRLGQLAHDFPRIAEIEINPLTVLAQGVAAVDVRVRVDDPAV